MGHIHAGDRGIAAVNQLTCHATFLIAYCCHSSSTCLPLSSRTVQQQILLVVNTAASPSTYKHFARQFPPRPAAIIQSRRLFPPHSLYQVSNVVRRVCPSAAVVHTRSQSRQTTYEYGSVTVPQSSNILRLNALSEEQSEEQSSVSHLDTCQTTGKPQVLPKSDEQ